MLIASQFFRECLVRLNSAVRAPGMLAFAFLLLPYAALLVGLDVAARYGEVTEQYLPVQFFLSQDGSFGEYLEYALMLSMAVMLAVLGASQKRSFLFAFACLFLVLTADNALQIHEDLGAQLAPIMPKLSFIEPHHIGEILVFAAIAAIWGTAAIMSLIAPQPGSLRDAAILSFLVFAIAVFGVVFDVITSFEGHSNAAIQILAFLEDGGEFAMIIAAFLVVAGMYERDRGAEATNRVEGPQLSLALSSEGGRAAGKHLSS